MDKKIIIIGAGLTGLGAGYRLQELGYKNWKVYEKNNHVGGLATSYRDRSGFIWDIGGHVIFSHYKYFDNYLEKLLHGAYTEHKREAWIRMMDRFIPYPFQNNIRYLPKNVLWECVLGILEAQGNFISKSKITNFLEFNERKFGSGIVKYFMFPYNFKVWSYPLKMLSANWVKERVSVVDIKQILENIILGKDDSGWGPNDKFKFPLRNGIGDIAQRIYKILKENIYLNKELKKIDINKRRLYFGDRSTDNYDYLISSIPLTKLVYISNLSKKYQKLVKNLKYSSNTIVGIGLKGQAPRHLKTKCWIYFPENNCPFYRATIFSNYSPYNVPHGHWSIMTEISHSKYRKINPKTIIKKTIAGLIRTGLIKSQKNIVSKWRLQVPYGYPIPSIDRDAVLKKIQPLLMRENIYSRGRFGAWKYEIGNMDHSTMQGVDIINFILKKEKEKTWR